MATTSDDNKYQPFIPLGGIGTGYFQLDPYGRLHNHLLHPHTPTYLLSNSYPVLRLETEQRKFIQRILCVNDDHALETQGLKQPPFLNSSQYKQQHQYPVTTCIVRDGTWPVKVLWTYFSPVAPYDHQASVMPAILLGMRVANTSREPLLCSAAFVLDNMAMMEKGDNDTAHIIRVEPSRQDSHFDGKMFRGALASPMPGSSSEYCLNGILFGERRQQEETRNTPHFCLAVKESLHSKISASVWNTQDAACTERIWRTWGETGDLPLPEAGMPNRAGAVCSSAIIAPGTMHRFDFILAWHVPAAISGQYGVSNGYLQHYPNTTDTAAYAFKHIAYLFTAVNNWHKHLISSSLPAPFVKTIIQSAQTLSTHLHHTCDGRVMMVSEKDDTLSPLWQWDIFASLALLSFAPRFHSFAVSTAIAGEQSLEEGEKNALVANRRARLVLAAFADVLHTGNRARLQEWLPQLYSIFDPAWCECAMHSEDEDASDSYGSSLGVCLTAAAALTFLAKHRNDADAVQRYEQLSATLAEKYDKELSTLATTDDACPHRVLAALSGALAARVLHLGPVVPSHTVKALLEPILACDDASVFTVGEKIHAILGKVLFVPIETEEMMLWFQPLLEWLPKGPVHQNSAPEPLTVEPEMLGVWTALSALTGLSYNALDNAMILRLSALHHAGVQLPVFIPVSLGKLVIKKESQSNTELQVRLSLDTPTAINVMTLYLPASLKQKKVSCSHDGETLSVRCQYHSNDEGSRVVLRFLDSFKLTSELVIRLRDA